VHYKRIYAHCLRNACLKLPSTATVIIKDPRSWCRPRY